MATNSSRSLQPLANIETQEQGSIKVVIKIAEHEHVQPTQPPFCHYIILYYIILYCIVLYCIVLYCIVLYCIVLHYTI